MGLCAVSQVAGSLPVVLVAFPVKRLSVACESVLVRLPELLLPVTPAVPLALHRCSVDYPVPG